VTVYAKDAFGYIGASETLTFAIAEEPFPTASVAAASAAAVLSAECVVVYVRRRKRQVAGAS
jgi:hypothetical protein